MKFSNDCKHQCQQKRIKRSYRFDSATLEDLAMLKRTWGFTTTTEALEVAVRWLRAHTDQGIERITFDLPQVDRQNLLDTS